MLYLSGTRKGDKLGVKDTEDNVIEYYDKQFLLDSGLTIYGLNKKLENGDKFEDEWFYYEYVKSKNISGLYAICRNRFRVREIIQPVLRAVVAGERVISLDRCFERCSVVGIDFSKMDTRYVVSASEMFNNSFCVGEVLDLSKLNLGNLEDAEDMFTASCCDYTIKDCNLNVEDEVLFKPLKHIKLGDIPCNKIRNMNGMFYGNDRLSIDLTCIENWDGVNFWQGSTTNNMFSELDALVFVNDASQAYHHLTLYDQDRHCNVYMVTLKDISSIDIPNVALSEVLGDVVDKNELAKIKLLDSKRIVDYLRNIGVDSILGVLDSKDLKKTRVLTIG